MKKPANDMARSDILMLLSLRGQGGRRSFCPAKHVGWVGGGGMGEGGVGLFGMYVWIYYTEVYV